MQVVDFLGSAAFSKAVQAIDLKAGGLVCLKIVKVCMLPSPCGIRAVYSMCSHLGCCMYPHYLQLNDARLKTRFTRCCACVQNNKDYFDQSLDEIKLLRYINDNDPADEHGVLRLYDYFYHKACCSVASLTDPAWQEAEWSVQSCAVRACQPSAAL